MNTKDAVINISAREKAIAIRALYHFMEIRITVEGVLVFIGNGGGKLNGEVGEVPKSLFPHLRHPPPILVQA